MTRKSKLCRWLGRVFWLSAVAVAGYTWYYIDQTVPDWVSIIQNQEEEFSLGLSLKATTSSDNKKVPLGDENNIPADQITANGKQYLSMFAQEQGSYQVGLRLFGVVKPKDTQMDVVGARYIIPCGKPIGICLKPDGVMVIGTGRVTGTDGMEVEPTYEVLKSGNYIETFNGKLMKIKEDPTSAVNESGGQDSVISIWREEEPVDASVKPVESSDGRYELGAWVRGDTRGIGTITYVDMNGNFGVLGHRVSDSDIGDLVETSQGALYSAEIVRIEKDTIGKPGLLSGVIYYGPQSHMGDITLNTDEGVFGTVNQQHKKQLTGESMEAVCRRDVKPGIACIRSDVSGQLEDYEIKIQKVDYNTSHKNKSMAIKVTDQRLSDLIGEIVQGVNGSLIMQDGELTEAVTHMFVQDASREYGILAGNILEH